MLPLRTATAAKLLQNNVFDIEFHGYLSNHAKHAIVALDRIGAPERRIQEYWDSYTDLTPYSLALHPVDTPWDDVQTISKQEFKDLQGKKSKWQEQVVFLREESTDNDIEKLVRQYVPPLLSGIAGGLTHGIIHLGWAIDAQSFWMALEGVAYLNFCNLGVDPKLLSRGHHKDDTLPLDSYIRVAETFHNSHLAPEWVQKAKSSYDESFHPELVASGFQWKAAKVMNRPHEVATQLPAWLDSEPIDAIFESLYRAVVVLYLSSRDENGFGSFLLLHFVTCLWGLEQTCRVIGDDAVTRDALGQFYAMSVCLMATSGFPSAQALTEVHHHHPVSQMRLDPCWSSIMQKGMAEVEEHNIKLVYVCHELWQRYEKWSGFAEAATSFTLTPNISPEQTSFSMDS